MQFTYTDQSIALQDQLNEFYRQYIIPRWRDWRLAVLRDRLPEPSFTIELRRLAKEQGLWNLGLPDLRDDEPGTRLNNLDYAPLAEIMGRWHGSARVFNCQAPDVPNMITLQHFATDAQRRAWLTPLLEGEIKSAFAMTEYAVASSDPTNLQTRFQRDGDEYVINGHKWFASGASHRDCEFLIVIGVTDPDGPRTKRHSALIVPMDTPGVKLTRELPYLDLGGPGAAGCEIKFEDARVPVDNLLGAEGDGFVSGQVRLGPARVHHCMRAVGNCEMLIELMMARAEERSTFGRTVSDYDAVQQAVAYSRIELEQARLLILKTAWLLDQDGLRSARREVSMIKVAVAQTYHRIADRALHIFGAMGGTPDTPIAEAYSWARAFRVADGPDEVHLRQVYRGEPKSETAIANSPHILPTEDLAGV